MKESRLIEMKNKIEMLGQAVQFLVEENKRLRDLAVGTLETVKRIPGYGEAIDELKNKLKKDGEKKKVETPAAKSS